MIKVMIADDEQIQRDGLARHIPWQQLDMNLVHSASDGQDALYHWSDDPPDLLITDVKMPKINGLELGRRAKSLNSRLKIVYISGFDEFEFAKKAIEVNASAYLLKPVNIDEITRLLEKIRDTIHSEQEVAYERLRLRSDLDKTRSQIIDSYLHEIVQSDLEDEDYFRRKAARYSIPLPSGDFRILSVSWDPVVDVCQLPKSPEAVRVATIIRECSPKREEPLIMLQDCGILVVMPCDKQQLETQAWIHRIEAEMKRQWLDIDFNLRLSESQSSISKLALMARPLLSDGNDRSNMQIKRTQIIQTILDLLEQNYNQQITIEDLAKKIYLTPNYISNLFKEAVGLSIINYLIKIRMKHAKRLLEDDTYKIYEIADMTGYNSTSYFSIAFKHSTGMSPKEYRDRLQRSI